MTTTVALVLAAGRGSRMRSRIPKVLHPVAGRSMLEHAIRAVVPTCDAVITVVSRNSPLVLDEVEKVTTLVDVPVHYAVQEFQRGTADAAAAGVAYANSLGIDSHVYIITYGDVPLLESATLQEIVEAHHASEATVTITSFITENASGYGRIVRSHDGNVQKIVEHRDASIEELQIQEVNSGIYVIDAPFLAENLPLISDCDNSAGEKYITDIVEIAVQAGRVVTGYIVGDSVQLLGCNNQHELLSARQEYNKRVVSEHLSHGVRIDDPTSTWIDSSVIIESDAVILPGTFLYGNTVIGAESVIGPSATIIDSCIGTKTHITRSEVHASWIGNNVSIGPYAFVRMETAIDDQAIIGTFVETKKAAIACDTKIRHLSYVGDATIGEGTNIGAGTIFVNYDGVDKYHTTVGSHVRIGSATTLIAPVTIGDGAYTGADAVIREPVPPGALAISQGNKQRIIRNWVRKKRSGTVSDIASQAVRENYEDSVHDKIP